VLGAGAHGCHQIADRYGQLMSGLKGTHHIPDYGKRGRWTLFPRPLLELLAPSAPASSTFLFPSPRGKLWGNYAARQMLARHRGRQKIAAAPQSGRRGRSGFGNTTGSSGGLHGERNSSLTSATLSDTIAYSYRSFGRSSSGKVVTHTSSDGI
jgi:hypothetical protein